MVYCQNGNTDININVYLLDTINICDGQKVLGQSDLLLYLVLGCRHAFWLFVHVHHGIAALLCTHA